MSTDSDERSAMDESSLHRVRVHVSGIVQGVGFRPFVHSLATELALTGFVRNDESGLLTEIEGSSEAVARFLELLEADPPPLALIEDVVVDTIPASGSSTPFTIDASRRRGVSSVSISPDVSPCAECLEEIDDPLARRHGYPFTNCTNCGPRLTIVRTVPYDRGNTTMVDFDLCADCLREYEDPRDRRFHAQPLCCPRCGPQLDLLDSRGTPLATASIPGAARFLNAGLVVAVKGVGGYQLMVDARSEPAVARLRDRKHREEKPFALMVADLAAARALCEVDAQEAEVLEGLERPIVLLRRRRTPHAHVASSVAPGNSHLGVMLPASPLHVLLAAAVDRPIVLTSGNRSDEPIVHRDRDVVQRLRGIADGYLTHDRKIEVPVDDSVVRMVAGRVLPVRRARGFAPRPVALPWNLPRHVLGCGAHLKNTVCLARSTSAFVTQHLGDLGNPETRSSFESMIEHYSRLFEIRPEIVAHDLHPEYASTAHAERLAGVELVGVQHHHAHIASCLVDNGLEEAVIGVAFDGLGFGTDATAWGGEILVADLVDFERAGHLRAVAMPGGDRATKEPWRMAVSHLVAADADGAGREVRRRHAEAWPMMERVARSGVNAPLTSSMGRLFDAVAALLGVRDVISYEGQAAIELEQMVEPSEVGTYPVEVVDGAPFGIDPSALVVCVAADVDAGTPVAVVAGRFHNWVVDVIVESCDRVRRTHGLGVVALSGGVFQNALVVERSILSLEHRGFRVLTHRQVPPNDGGISLGQVAVAGARDRRS